MGQIPLYYFITPDAKMMCGIWAMDAGRRNDLGYLVNPKP
jgi:hypothetical protein